MKNQIKEKIENLKREKDTIEFILNDMGELLEDPTYPMKENLQTEWDRKVARLREIRSELKSLTDIDEVASIPDIGSGMEKFNKDFPDGMRTAFIIMRFSETKQHEEIVSCIRATLETYNIMALRADDKDYMDDKFHSIKVYMHGCDFGIAVFDRIIEDDFNPNVSLEVGYMLGMGKDVLLLKDKTLSSLQSDLDGKLYKPFDTQDIANTMPKKIGKWLFDKGFQKD